MIKANIANSQAVLIKLLNSLLRGWGNYYSHVCAKRAFHKIDHEIICALWKLAKKRHTRKGLYWIKNCYFKVMKSTPMGLCCIHMQEQTERDKVILRLLRLIDIPIRRHIKIRVDANPFDFKWKKYFDERVKRTKMLLALPQENVL
ncbi:group II intron maturase-specific domain-containing protein [Wolbachia endosymbiont of Pentidionis agamae]|uniref:group II intron maturase-specific domain-containing protein n=1 Tax=Wolbachia endosymbiont of Pentidionis agamae TaxID=3110435 RepID=UPI002FD1B89B